MVNVALIFLATLLSPVLAGQNWVVQMEVQMSKPSVATMAEFQERVMERGKPGIVFVTQDWCGACDFLKSNINDSAMKDRMNEFEVISIEVSIGFMFCADAPLTYSPKSRYTG